MKYAITYAVNCTATKIVDLDAPPTVDEAEDLTDMVTLCHQCSRELDIGDPGEVWAIYEIGADGKKTPIFEKDF